MGILFFIEKKCCQFHFRYVILVVSMATTKQRGNKMTFNKCELEILQLTEQSNIEWVKKMIQGQIEKADNTPFTGVFNLEKKQWESVLNYMEKMERNARKIEFAVEQQCKTQEV